MKQTLHLASVVVLLLAAPAFGETIAAEGWRPYAAREEIAPRSWSDRDAQGGLRLGLAGRGDDAVDGRWAREVPVVPGKTYGFGAAYRAQGRRLSRTERARAPRLARRGGRNDAADGVPARRTPGTGRLDPGGGRVPRPGDRRAGAPRAAPALDRGG